jgi:hypothetical protein
MQDDIAILDKAIDKALTNLWTQADTAADVHEIAEKKRQIMLEIYLCLTKSGYSREMIIAEFQQYLDEHPS